MLPPGGELTIIPSRLVLGWVMSKIKQVYENVLGILFLKCAFQDKDWNAMRWSWKWSLGFFPCSDDHYVFTFSSVQAGPWISVDWWRSPGSLLELAHGLWSEIMEQIPWISGAADIQAWFNLWVTLIPRSRLESEQNVYGQCSALPDCQWCSTGWEQLGIHWCGFLFSLLTHAGFVCELVKPQTALGGSGLADRYLLPDNWAWSLCQLPGVPPVRDPVGADQPSEAQPGWQSADRAAQRAVLGWDHLYKVCAPQKLSLQGEHFKLGLREAVWGESLLQELPGLFSVCCKVSLRICPFVFSVFPSLLSGQLWGLLFLCCLMLPLLFSSSGEPHSSKLARSDIYWLIPMIWSALCPDPLSLLPGRVNFLIRVFCFALWGEFQLLSFRTKAVLVKQMSVATGDFAGVLLTPDWGCSVLTGCLRSMYPATGSPPSLLDSYILKTLKNSSLPKTIWRSCLTRRTVRTAQCWACISKLSCREEPKNVKIMA